MPHLQLIVEHIKSTDDLFAASLADGSIVAIRQCWICGDDGIKVRTARITKELLKHLENQKIPVV